MGIKEKIVKNTLYNIVSYGYSAIVGFFLVPFVIKKLGLNRYGIWSLITMITGYFSLIDFGIGQSFERYIAEYKAKNEIENLNYVINSGLLIYLFLFFILIPLSIFSQNFLIKILKIPEELHSEAKFIFKWAIIYIGISNIFGLFYSCIRGFQRMDITGKITIFLTTLHAIGVILFLNKGWGVKGLMVNNFFVYSCGGLIYLVMVYKIFPEIRLNFLLFEKSILKRMGKFGIKRWVTSIEEVITYQTDKFFISRFLNIALVGIYQIGYTIPEKMANMIRLLNSAVVPASAELKALNDREKLIKLHIYGLKYISTVAFPLMFFTITTAPLIINVWVGPGYEKAVVVLRLFCLIFLISLLSSNLTAILVGIEKPEYQMYYSIYQSLLNLLLTFYLIKKIGFIGVIIATFISVSLGNIYLQWIFHKIFKISFLWTFKSSLYYSLKMSLGLSILLWLINWHLIVTKIFSSWILLILEFFIFFSLYFILEWKGILKYFSVFSKK